MSNALRRSVASLLVLAVLGTASPARSDDRGPPSAVAAATAVVPGALVHGTGHLVMGRKKTGMKLLVWEGIGLGLLGGGLLAVRATGASRRVVSPLTYVTLAGASLFFLTLAADLYGTLAPLDARGAGPSQLPWIETRFGVRGIHDPTFAYGLLLEQGIDWRKGPVRVSPSATFALDDTNRRLRIETAYRVKGPRPETTDAPVEGAEPPSSPPNDGSFVDLDGAVMDHAYTSDGFARTTGELAIHGRLDLVRMAGDLRGSFIEGSAGAALASIRYRAGNTETDQLLLGRFGFGFYLGKAWRPRGEVTAFYDHRRDGYVAGMKVPGIGAGFLGSVGAAGRYFLDERWGVQLDVQAGSAIAGGASILFREGAVR